MRYIKYTCKHCGKQYRIIEQWGDLKPQKCTGKKGVKVCPVRFDVNPELLDIQRPADTSKTNTDSTNTKKSSKNKKKHKKEQNVRQRSEEQTSE